MALGAGDGGHGFRRPLAGLHTDVVHGASDHAMRELLAAFVEIRLPHESAHEGEFDTIAAHEAEDDWFATSRLEWALGAEDLSDLATQGVR
jgi:hypothetical protein